MTEKLINIRAKKSLGQNFLIDESALFDIAHSVSVWQRNIVEVGPWYGALTDYLIEQKPETLTLVELDNDMIDILENKIKGNEWWVYTQLWVMKYRITKEDIEIPINLLHQDVLQFVPQFSQYSVIANIPYYITSPILFHFLYSREFVSPESMVIMMQEEVGEKIVEWRARKPHHSYLSLAMELACDDIEIIRYVGKESFDPAPKVDSIVLRFVVRRNRDKEQEERLLALWRCSFQHPRKTLLSNLKGSIYDIKKIRDILMNLGYDERVRAEAVKMEDWKRFL